MGFTFNLSFSAIMGKLLEISHLEFEISPILSDIEIYIYIILIMQDISSIIISSIISS